MADELKIITYPDPRLKWASAPVERFDDDLAALARRMLELMRERRGVGLAAPQVGVNIRMFVMNPTGEDADARVYVNPVLSDTDGEETSEEGCLSIPEVNADISRSLTATLTALDLSGKPVKETATGYLPRIWQHEIDHLDGVLILDRMGMTARMLARKTLRELEAKYAAEHPPSKKPRVRARR